MRYLLCAVLMLLIPMSVHSAPGKVILQNGHMLRGDIRKLPDGSYWVTTKSGSIKFESPEIKRVTFSSGNDTVKDRFLLSLSNTPSKKHANRPASTPYDNLIHREARRNHIDPALVKAVVKAESNFNVKDRSAKGACGLMQLMPQTASLLGVRDIFSPEENIRAGTRFLRDMLSLYDGNMDKALAAYNAGPGTVNRYGDVPPYRETREYINRVYRYYRNYRQPGAICTYSDQSGRLTIYNVR